MEVYVLNTTPTFSQSLMVSVGVSKLGFTDLIIVDPGVKINGAYYRDVLLSQHLLPVVRNVSGERVLHFPTGQRSSCTPGT